MNEVPEVQRRRRRRKKLQMPKYFMQKGLRTEYETALKNVSVNCQHIMKYYSLDKMKRDMKEGRLKPGEYPKAFLEALDGNLECYHSMRGPMINRYPIEISHVYREEIGEIFHKEKFTAFLCEYVVELYGKLDKTSSQRKTLESAINLLLDYTNFSETVVDDIMTIPDMVQTAVKAVKDPAEKQGFDEKMYVWMLYLLSNCSRVYDYHLLMREKFTMPLFGLMNLNPKDDVRLAILAILANITNEEQASYFKTNKGAVRHVINKLGNSLNNYRPFMGRTLESGGWSCTELGEIIRQLARNDVNKRLLMKENCIPKLMTLAKLDDVYKQKVALEAIWNLSFDKENQEDMVKDKALVQMVTDLYEVRELQKAASGILWNLKELMSKQPDVFHRILTRLHEDSGDVPLDDDSDDDQYPLLARRPQRSLIKMSYNIDNQHLVKRIREQLVRGGYKVLGSDQFAECNMSQAMAVVDKATIIIICISQKYKDSEDCRTEAEHASKKKKAIIPLLLEKSYQPDGWVHQIMVEVEMFFRFDNLHTFESNIEGLLRQVQVKVSKADAILVVAGKARSDGRQGLTLQGIEAAPTITLDLLNEVSNMTPEDVCKWTKRFNLSETLDGMTGTKLAGWLRLKHESTDFFYRSLGPVLQLSIDSGQVFNFANLLDALYAKLM